MSCDYHIRTDCRLCSGPIEKVLDLGETALANELKSTREESLAQDRFPLFLSQCKACGHVQLPVVVKPERLFPPDYPYKSGTNPVFRAHLNEFAETVSAMLPKRAVVIEIASNDGTLLKEFSSRGHFAVGFEPATDLAKKCCAEGDVVVGEFFNNRNAARWLLDVPYPPKPHAIVALNVFAHVDDMNDFTAGVAALLPDDGLFVFEVGYLPDVIAKGLFDVIYHEHLSYHSLRPLVPFFRRHGLELVDAHRVDSQGGSVRCFVRKEGHDWKGHGRLQQMLKDEEGLSVEPLKAKVERLKYYFMAIARSSRTGEITVAGFGAPAKLTTLWQALCSYDGKVHCRMLSAEPSVIYDDNPAKVGRFTPGTGIPIRPMSELLANNPDCLILFSWNFADEVMPRLRALGYRGKIVVPLPEFRVVE